MGEAHGSPNTCQWHVAGKHKVCQRAPLSGLLFCELHRRRDEDAERRCCELCKQSVQSCRWSRHQNVCSAARQKEPPYFHKGCNVCFGDYEERQEGSRGVEGTEEETDIELRHRLLSLYRLHVEPVLLSLTYDDIPEVHACLTIEQQGLPPASSLVRFAKHRRQEASIAGHLLRSGIVPSVAETRPRSAIGDTNASGDEANFATFLDLGSGKGSLSLSLSKVSADRSDLAFVCIDRQPYQQQAEKTIIKSQRRYRAKVDLADVNLRKLLDAAQEEGSLAKPGSVVGVGKHLCGSALDYALNALGKYKEEDEGRVPPLRGLAIASCCHSSIASLDATAAGPWLRETCGLNDVSFAKLRKWSGFFDISMAPVSMAPGSDEEKDVAERLELGRACKRLIDFGRAEFIRKHLGLSSVSLLHYVDTSVSPENCLILAK